ncbi:MAG: putative DNA binding domain-containing protein [Ktedonobacteraceae bacterium]|nr:putative DNA binding domain-containing protein [Ktedonobacteraceae bacterium]
MDFVDWCSVVLNKLIEAESIALDELYLWEDQISSHVLGSMFFGEDFEYNLSKSNKVEEECYASIYWAINELKQLDLVEMNIYEIEDTEKKIVVDEPKRLHKKEYENEEEDFIESLHQSPKEYLGLLPPDHVEGLYESSSENYLPDHVKSFTCNITEKGVKFAKKLFRLWQEICIIELDQDQQTLLRHINLYSPKSASDHYWLEGVVFTEYNDQTTPEDLAAMRTLKRLGFVTPYFRNFYDPFFELRSTYKGLVWDTRRGLTLESMFIDKLVAEWETTSVDFKRELHLDNADQKAEFVKDVLSLVNTQASGRRWLIIGFRDKERTYFGPPDTNITQDRIEQIIAQYITPYIDIRYKVANYRVGHVGMLEIIRDPKKLPYRMKTKMDRGDRRKSIQGGTIFVRHGSHVAEPTDEELQVLQEEGDRARSI